MRLMTFRPFRPAAAFAAAFATALLLPMTAQAQDAARLLAAQSEIGFTIRQMGVPVEGRFQRYDVQARFDPKKPDAAKIAFSIDLASASLGNAETDAELVKPDWLDARAHPRATFESSSVKATGPGRYDVAGKLAIKGVSRNVVVPVVLAQAGSPALTTATGAFAIKRLEYRIGDGDWKDPSLVADEVRVRFKLVLGGVAPI